MIKVNVINNVYIGPEDKFEYDPKLYEERITKTYTGVVGFRVNDRHMDLTFFNNRQLLVPIHEAKIERLLLTDEEILNGEDKEFAAWYQAQVAAAEKKTAEAEGGIQRLVAAQ